MNIGASAQFKVLLTLYITGFDGKFIGVIQAESDLAGLQGQLAAAQASGNGNAGWSWLDAFEARQKALAAQAAGENHMLVCWLLVCQM